MELFAQTHKILSRIHLDYYRSIHSIKTAIACIIGVALVKFFNLPTGQWIPITIIVVMSAQAHFGGALQKAYMRLLGTLAGITITICTLHFFGINTSAIFIIVGLACLLFTYIASGGGDVSYAGTLGGVTLVLTLTGQQTTINYALQRGSYIIIGIIIALLVSRFILPIHARDLLRISIANTLKNLQILYFKALTPCDIKSEFINTELEGKIAKDLSEQPTLIHEAIVGSKVFAHKKELFHEILNIEHKIRRLIILMYKCLCETTDLTAMQQQLTKIADLHKVVKETLANTALCFITFEVPTTIVDLDNALNKINNAVEELPTKEAPKLIAEHSLLFFIQQLLKEIYDLQQLVGKINSQ
jgi:hypothetical protein